MTLQRIWRRGAEVDDWLSRVATSSTDAARLISAFAESGLAPVEVDIVKANLSTPSATVEELCRRFSVDAQTIARAYAFARANPDYRAFVQSAYYHHRLMTQIAQEAVAELMEDPRRGRALLVGLSWTPRTVEIHPTLGTCSYKCAMCLWASRDHAARTPSAYHAAHRDVLATDGWLGVLDSLQAMHVRTIVFSGGGELLLNHDLGALLSHTRKLGVRTHVYTSGAGLDRAPVSLLKELAHCAQVRLSIHGSTERFYSRVVGLPERSAPLARVSRGIERLLSMRTQLGTDLRVGAGFVLQPINAEDLPGIAHYSRRMGLDFLAIRKDEIDATGRVTDWITAETVDAICTLREDALNGLYQPLSIDFSDDLVAMANGLSVQRLHHGECRVKYVRPAVAPNGVISVCDLRAEPRFAESEFSFGEIANDGAAVFDVAATRFVEDTCGQCMPSSRAINAVYAKLALDLRAGFAVADQPFGLP